MNDDDRKHAAEAYGADAPDKFIAMFEPKPKRPRSKRPAPCPCATRTKTTPHRQAWPDT